MGTRLLCLRHRILIGAELQRKPRSGGGGVSPPIRHLRCLPHSPLMSSCSLGVHHAPPGHLKTMKIVKEGKRRLTEPAYRYDSLWDSPVGRDCVPANVSYFRRRGYTTRDVPPLQGSSSRRPESRGLRPWLFSTAPLGLDPAPKERQAIARGVSPGYSLRRVRALKGRHTKKRGAQKARESTAHAESCPSPLVLVVPSEGSHPQNLRDFGY